MQEPAAIVVRGEWIFEDAVVDVAIRADGGGSAAIVGDRCIHAGPGVLEADNAKCFQSGAIEGDQIAISEIEVVHTDVNQLAIRGESGSTGHVHFCVVGVITCGSGGNPDACAGGRNSREAALERDGRGTQHHEAKENVFLRIGGEGSVVFNVVVEGGAVRGVIVQAVKHEAANGACGLVGIGADEN